MPNMDDIFKMAQEAQAKLMEAQNNLDKIEVEGVSGGGMVKIAMNGKYEVQSVKLAKDAVDPDDVEALEDLLLAAFNSAKAKVEAASSEKMGGLTKGLGIPGI